MREDLKGFVPYLEQFFILKKSYGFTLIKLIVDEISKMNHLKVDQYMKQ